jgi:hypothetical protein
MINKDRKIEGLRERIASAKSPEDVTKLLDEGATYTQASDRTRNAWRNTATRRLGELTTKRQSAIDRGALDKADKANRERQQQAQIIREGVAA